jgi:hypothetical protein
MNKRNETQCNGSNDDYIFVECIGITMVLQTHLVTIDQRNCLGYGSYAGQGRTSVAGQEPLGF